MDKQYRSVPTNTELILLGLKPGLNNVIFSIKNDKERINCLVFFWDYNSRIVICDIDGTITRSDVGGHIMPIFGNDWTQPGIAQLLTTIYNNGYKVLYLSARSVELLGRTKKYLKMVKQGDCVLPCGPVVMSTEGIFASLALEVIKRKPQEFKIPALLNIQRLFPTNHNPFYAAYGNRKTDIISYIAAGIKVMNVYTINEDGTVVCKSKISPTSYMKLLEHTTELFPMIDNSK